MWLGSMMNILHSTITSYSVTLASSYYLSLSFFYSLVNFLYTSLKIKD